MNISKMRTEKKWEYKYNFVSNLKMGMGILILNKSVESIKEREECSTENDTEGISVIDQ